MGGASAQGELLFFLGGEGAWVHQHVRIRHMLMWHHCGTAAATMSPLLPIPLTRCFDACVHVDKT